MKINASTTIWDLAEKGDIDTRLANCLKNDSSDLVVDIISRTEKYYINTPNFGRKSLQKLKDLLAKHGLKLADPIVISKDTSSNAHPKCAMSYLFKEFRNKIKKKYGRSVDLYYYQGEFICSERLSSEKFSEAELGFIQGFVYALKQLKDIGAIK